MDGQGGGQSMTGEEGDRPGAAHDDVDAKAAARRAFIEATAAALGRSWAEARRAELHREGRPAAGGWPGTLREARSCVERELSRELKDHRMTAITTNEREMAARATYASARVEWRRCADPEEPFFDEAASGPKNRIVSGT
ncbi:hypothetical protein [Polyangium aurulentum]|uniref:hypothetical protein n=1 Tax=Polyangium aurulentum TaxID=2567896 RepID=UPI0010AEDDFD|nr:hypothetical protein [Polyangium aurulentum]UQA58515.1 hypothetical protein E8A73_045975 [Polyangium aurulentum]